MRRASHLPLSSGPVPALALAGCGGGGGGPAPTAPAQPTVPIASPTVAPPILTQAVSGNVVSIPVGTYGAAAAPQTPLVGATVVIGPALIQSATLPAVLPGGDVIAITNTIGSFSTKLNVLPAAPPYVPPGGPGTVTNPVTFVPPAKNVFNVQFPAKGYYVMVFPAGADGKTTGTQLPVHAFVAVGSNGALGTFRSTTPSVDEAGWLLQANLDRGAKGQVPEFLDESAEEAARQHAAEMAVGNDAGCDYNAQNEGPLTRYDSLGGLGEDLSNIAGYGGPPSTTTAVWHAIEAGFVAEGGNPPPGNYHYETLTLPYAIWFGLAIATSPFPAGGPGGIYYAADMENVNVTNPNTLSYDVAANSCPPGIVANGS